MGGLPPNGSDGSNDRGHGGDPTDISTRQPLQTMMIIGSRNMGPKSSVPEGERARETGLHFSPPQIDLALVPLAAADVWTERCPILPPPTGKDGGSRCLAVSAHPAPALCSNQASLQWSLCSPSRSHLSPSAHADPVSRVLSSPQPHRVLFWC
jgi:hypothetical protein